MKVSTHSGLWGRIGGVISFGCLRVGSGVGLRGQARAQEPHVGDNELEPASCQVW